MLSGVAAHAQIARDFLVGGGFDLIKTDNDGFAEKLQLGLEGNYFITRRFTATGGLEFWTGDQVSLVVGTRWFPSDEAFVRLRGLIGTNDLSVGAGWTKPLNESLKFEAIGDFYFSVDFAIRAGLVYVIRRK